MAPGIFLPRTSKDCGSSSILVHLLDGLLDWEDPTSLVKGSTLQWHCMHETRQG
jgi:hypothetical protein